MLQNQLSQLHRIPLRFIRNWQEDYQRQCEELQNFLIKKEKGELEIQRHRRKLAFHYQPVPTSKADTTFVTFGVPVQLANGVTRLVVDVGSEANTAHVTATTTASAVVVFRAAIVLQPSPEPNSKQTCLNEQRDKSILHYGEHIAISLCSPLNELLLFSVYAGISRQPVAFSLGHGRNFVWQVLPAEPYQRELCLGLPVAYGDSVLVRHCATGQLLCLENSLVENEFGAEVQVTARTILGANRRAVCKRTAQGDILGELGPPASPENCWTIASGCNRA